MTTERPEVTPTGLYPVSKAAALLEVNRRTVYNWIDKGVFMKREVSRRRYGREEQRITGAGILRVWQG